MARAIRRAAGAGGWEEGSLPPQLVCGTFAATRWVAWAGAGGVADIRGTGWLRAWRTLQYGRRTAGCGCVGRPAGRGLCISSRGEGDLGQKAQIFSLCCKPWSSRSNLMYSIIGMRLEVIRTRCQWCRMHSQCQERRATRGRGVG